jgi:hypothetical protein
MTIDTSIADRTQGFVRYRGRPDWLTEPALAALVDESARLRASAGDVGRQAHSPAGPVARGFARSTRLLDLVTGHAGPVRPSGNANYLYYDKAGAGIDPHIDSPDFPWQVLLMLTHSGYGERRSSLVVFPDGPSNPVPVVLDPGELVLFRAASVYHGRTNAIEGERLVLLGVGYVTPAS